MLSVTLLSVGTLKKSWCAAGCSEYIKRLNHSYNFKIIELPASKQKYPLKQREEESKNILSSLSKMKGTYWVLDELGEEHTSASFAKAMSNVSDIGESIIFILGGSYGLNDKVRERADKIISFSKMTFPHELCRLFFLEQLYRAVEINKGSAYHH